MDSLLGSKVKIRYTGTLDDGTEFDSSKNRCGCGRHAHGHNHNHAQDYEHGHDHDNHTHAQRHGQSDVCEYVVGSSSMLPGFNRAVSEMQEPGQKISIKIPAAEAYGSYNEELIEAVPVEAIPNAEQLPVGGRVTIETSAGTLRPKVLKIKDGFIYFDHNHELVDQDLTYEIELVGFLSALEREHDPAGCSCGCEEIKKTVGMTD